MSECLHACVCANVSVCICARTRACVCVCVERHRRMCIGQRYLQWEASSQIIRGSLCSVCVCACMGLVDLVRWYIKLCIWESVYLCV